MRVCLTQIEEKARRVDRHLVQKGDKRDRLAASLAGLDDLAAAHQTHHLHEERIETASIYAERRKRRL